MKVAVTQRVDKSLKYNEKRDCLDQRWTNFLDSFEFDFLLVPNNKKNLINWVEKENVQGLLLTGGNDLSFLKGSNNTSVERDETEKKLLIWAQKKSIPTLGICRGMQIMNHFLGGNLNKIHGHDGKNHNINTDQACTLFKHYTSVNSFHNWGISYNDISKQLDVVHKSSQQYSL